MLIALLGATFLTESVNAVLSTTLKVMLSTHRILITASRLKRWKVVAVEIQVVQTDAGHFNSLG
jgi:hypothetical protein